MDPTTFRLYSGSLTVPLTASEVIYSFTASNNPAYGTQPAALNWSVHPAFSVTLNNGIGAVANSSTLSVRHGNNTTITYTLTASLGSNTFTSSINVRFGYCTYTYGCDSEGADSRGNCWGQTIVTSTTCYY